MLSESRSHERTLRQNIRELPPHAWLLISGSFINRFGTFVVPFLVLYLRRKGYSIAESGAAVAAYGGGEVVAGPIGGSLADRIGRRRTIALSTFASAAAMMALYLSGTFAAIMALAFSAGLVSEARRPASLALLTDLVPEGQRVTVFAVLRLAENLAFAGGIALGGFLANRAFLWLFVGDSASSIAYGAIALLFLPEGHRARRRSLESTEAEGSPLVIGRAKARRARGYGPMLSDRAFLFFLVATVLLAFVYFQQQATLPLHVRSSGLSNADFGLLLSLNGVLVMLFELPLSSWTMHQQKRQIIAAGFLLVGIGFGLTAVAHTFAALAVTVAVWTAGEMLAAPVSYAYVADIAPADMRGRYQGLYGTAFGSGAIVGPAVGTFLYSHGETGFWSVCGALGLLAAGLALAARPSR